MSNFREQLKRIVKMRLMLLLVLLCSTLIVAIDDIKSTEKPAEAPTKTPTKDENNKSETVRNFGNIVLMHSKTYDKIKKI